MPAYSRKYKGQRGWGKVRPQMKVRKGDRENEGQIPQVLGVPACGGLSVIMSPHQKANVSGLGPRSPLRLLEQWQAQSRCSATWLLNE